MNVFIAEKKPKSCFRCSCAKLDEKKAVGKGKARLKDNTGLSCSKCKHKACTKCRKSDQYDPDTVTDVNIRMLKVRCPISGKSMILSKYPKHIQTTTIAKLQEEKRELEKKYSDLEKKNSDLEKKNSDLEKKNSDLEKKNSDPTKHADEPIEAQLKTLTVNSDDSDDSD